jgi:hypothetical protein
MKLPLWGSHLEGAIAPSQGLQKCLGIRFFVVVAVHLMNLFIFL